jgi:hypothetical protein
MCLDAGAVDEEPVRYALGSGKSTEDAFPDAALGPAHEAVVECLFGTINRRTIAPTPATLQRMDYPREHTAIVNPPRSLAVHWQQWLYPGPLTI